VASRAETVLFWTPRLAGAAVSLFVALFALDAFNGQPLTRTLPAVAMHLVPAAIVAAVVVVAWRHPWVGALGFGALAVAYAASVPARLDWIVAISGPLAITAILFAWSAARGSRTA
jgi:hypothetical protein